MLYKLTTTITNTILWLICFAFVSKIVPAGAPYFYAEIPGGVKLYCRISKGFPLQFGRWVSCS